jgi:hypothetical protein
VTPNKHLVTILIYLSHEKITVHTIGLKSNVKKGRFYGTGKYLHTKI